MPKIKSSKRRSKISISLTQCKIETPIGCMTAIADNDYIYLLDFEDSKKLSKKIEAIKCEYICQLCVGETSLLNVLKAELASYFEGTLKGFSTDVKFVGTKFQKEIWQQLSMLSYGDVMTYADFAKRLGRDSKHAGAIGSTAGANSLLIIVPCHRLVESGSQEGYCSREDWKTWLLKHEEQYKENN